MHEEIVEATEQESLEKMEKFVFIVFPIVFGIFENRIRISCENPN